ncbi:hypothetical protein TSUD_233430 [Trifolium subterraneum]|uniref:Uncharacterized protein n=1 Tax=Trifolium subterraneum TaxID=3900 RepID=A0A2Z6MFE0_TRISU|nr:hypothetical protein TSUD_233430 [Trifolium subterraneum]
MTDSIAIPQNVCLVFWVRRRIVWNCNFCISQGNSELGVMLYFPCVQVAFEATLRKYFET